MMVSAPCTEEKSLLIRAQGGDPDATELFLAAYVPLLNSLARRFYSASLPAQDLCQAGYIGLMLALKRYDGRQGVRFITYAMPWALGEMKRALRQTAASENGQRFNQRVTRELRRLSASLGREPRIEELAHACGLPASEIVCALEAGYTPQSLDAPFQDTGRTLLETLVSVEQIDEQKLDIHLALEHLPAQLRTLIVLRYARDHTQKETARIMGVSQSQASRMERHALDMLREWLK